jgi:hypothetical protein
MNDIFDDRRPEMYVLDNPKSADTVRKII